jgi:hypothetical protein
VVATPERHRKLVADLAAKRARLHEAQVVGIGRFAAADEARLLYDKPATCTCRGADGAGDTTQRFAGRFCFSKAASPGAFQKLALPCQRVADDGLQIVKVRLPSERDADAVASGDELGRIARPAAGEFDP